MECVYVYLNAYYLGLAKTIYTVYIRYIFGRDFTIYTDIYGACKRFWPTLDNYICCHLGIRLPGGLAGMVVEHGTHDACL